MLMKFEFWFLLYNIIHIIYVVLVEITIKLIILKIYYTFIKYILGSYDA